MNTAIILAGGSGTRFGSDLPKQYTEVLGKPILAYTLEVFQASPDIDDIAVVCQKEYADLVKNISDSYKISKLKHIIPGGRSCPESIKNGIYALKNDLGGNDNVLIHIGASPLVSTEDISAALEVCKERGCCYTMHPVNICMARRGGKDWAEEDAPKEDYIELNTPWAFRYGEILDLYAQLETAGHILSETDYTLGLWLASGRRAYYTKGSAPGRLKITTSHDKDLFEGYLILKKIKEVTGGKS